MMYLFKEYKKTDNSTIQNSEKNDVRKTRKPFRTKAE